MIVKCMLHSYLSQDCSYIYAIASLSLHLFIRIFIIPLVLLTLSLTGRVCCLLIAFANSLDPGQY